MRGIHGSEKIHYDDIYLKIFLYQTIMMMRKRAQKWDSQVSAWMINVEKWWGLCIEFRSERNFFACTCRNFLRFIESQVYSKIKLLSLEGRISWMKVYEIFFVKFSQQSFVLERDSLIYGIFSSSCSPLFWRSQLGGASLQNFF